MAVLPLLVVWVVLVAPDDPADQPLTWLLRVPVEPLLLGLLLLVLPGRWRGRAGPVVGAVVGALLGAAAVVKLLDIGFTSALRRPFDLLADWTYLRSARDLLADSVGAAWATAALVGCVVLVVGLLVVVPWSLHRAVARLEPHVDRHRRGWSRTLVVVSRGVVGGGGHPRGRWRPGCRWPPRRRSVSSATTWPIPGPDCVTARPSPRPWPPTPTPRRPPPTC